MSAPATALPIYLWHYVLARLLYDDLVRPLSRGHVAAALVLVAVAGVGFVLGRRA